jgi:hypothetical protein
MDFVGDFYALDNLVARERLRGALLLVGMAGVALLFLRSGAAKVAGGLLILARLVAMPMTGGEWMLLGSIALIGGIAVVSRRREEEPAAENPSRSGARHALEAAGPDDAREAAPCPACHAVIPAGSSRCPNCGWTYAADVP